MRQKVSFIVATQLSPLSTFPEGGVLIITVYFIFLRPHPLAMDELSSCMELALTDGNMEEMKYIFSLFQEHSCQDKEDPTSTKVLQNVSVLYEALFLCTVLYLVADWQFSVCERI